jgi:hypothetical protein
MASVVAPTLVLRSSDSAWSNEKETRRLVAGIPGAQMRIVSGTMVPWIADREAVLKGLVWFLTSGEYISGVHSDDELRTVGVATQLPRNVKRSRGPTWI